MKIHYLHPFDIPKTVVHITKRGPCEKQDFIFKNPATGVQFHLGAIR